MTVGITVPQTPIAAAPGAETRIRIEVHNLSGEAVSVRLSLAPSRAGAWGQADPPVLELPPGDGASAHLVFRPPSGTGPVATLLPFTVQAEDVRYGMPAARATGLLTIAPEQRVTAALARESLAPGVVTLHLRLTNRDDAAPMTLKLEPKLEPEGRVTVLPAVIDVSSGDTATARVQVRPAGRLTMSSTPYQLAVACRDVAAPADDPPLFVLGDAGTVPARLRARVTLPLALVLAGLIAAGYLVWTGTLKVPGWVPGAPDGGAPTAVTVGRPYALLEVFPRQDPTARSLADQALARVNSAGMSARLVDSLQSPDLADGQGGLWVVLRDGFGSLDEARAYCDRYRAVAPKCEAVP